MSVTNAIHGVILVGGTIAPATSHDVFTQTIGHSGKFGALNVVGGF